jgi:hypothetical protein
MSEIYMNEEELDIIKKVIKENKIRGAFKLIFDNSSGIGYTLDIEFDSQLKSRTAVIRIPITTSENW